MQRKGYNSIKRHIDLKEFTIITGARQVGKTTLIKQLHQEFVSKSKPTVFFNLERKGLLEEFNASPENLLKYCPESDERIMVFIDEVQYLNDPTNFIKLLFDEYSEKIKIVATGSSAFYIDKDFKDSLAGRKKIFEMKTLDFEEFLMFKAEKVLQDELLKLRSGAIQKSLSENLLWINFEEYMLYGGYPAVVMENSPEIKIDRLKDLRDSFLKRDILEAGVNNEEKFYKLCVLLANQIGNLININELSKTLRISNATVENYLYILQKCFHISLIKPFYNNVRKELVKMPKVYFNDLGLRNVMLNSFSAINLRVDKGALLENAIFRRLSEINSLESIKFWRTADGKEVDFVVEDSTESGQAIEVKFSETENKPNKYNLFAENYPAYPLEFWNWRKPELLL